MIYDGLLGMGGIGMNGSWYDDLMSYVFPMDGGVFNLKFGREYPLTG